MQFLCKGHLTSPPTKKKIVAHGFRTATVQIISQKRNRRKIAQFFFKPSVPLISNSPNNPTKKEQSLLWTKMLKIFNKILADHQPKEVSFIPEMQK